MPWAICEWCERVIGVMWNDPSTFVECPGCEAWISVERNEE